MQPTHLHAIKYSRLPATCAWSVIALAAVTGCSLDIACGDFAEAAAAGRNDLRSTAH